MIAAILPSPLCVGVVAFLLLSKGFYEAIVHRAELVPAAAFLLLLGPAYLVFQTVRQCRRWVGRGTGRRIKRKPAKAAALSSPTPEEAHA